MTETKEVQIRCTNPPVILGSPSSIFFGNIESFDTATLIGNNT